MHYSNLLLNNVNIAAVHCTITSIRYEPIPTAKGSLCYYKPKHGGDKWREAETFRSDCPAGKL